MPTGFHRSTRSNAGRGVERLHMDMKEEKYWSYLMKQVLIKNGIKIIKLKSARARSFLISKAVNDNQSVPDPMQDVSKVMFTWMSAKKGIHMFGERTIAALFKEFRQLDEGAFPGKPVFCPEDTTTLTSEEMSRALEAVNLIKEKING